MSSFLKGFPWVYKGAGYWRAKGVPKGVKAEVRHADQILEEFLDYSDGREIPLGYERPELERRVAGALKSCITAHGPITDEWTGSAAKRVISAIKVWNREKRENE